ncbi:MAG: MJ0042-type zinc finger domain-containing protein [Acidimicrobiia bacterium]
MAKALQCPQCGTKHRIDTLGTLGATIRCDRCGQTLRVPEAFRAVDSTVPQAAPAEPNVTGDRTQLDLENSILMAAVRAESGQQPAVPAAAAAYQANGPVPAAAPAAARTAVPAVPATVRRRRFLERPAGPRTIFDSIALRFAVWVACLAVAGYVCARIGNALGYLNKDQGLQIVNGDSIFNRYGRLAGLVLVWSLLAATLVQLVLEGGRWWLGRRDASGRET